MSDGYPTDEYKAALKCLKDKKWFQYAIRVAVAIGNRNTVEHPIPWDKRCFLNRTTSLCDRDALNEFRFCFRNIKSLRAVFVSTDGAEDCFADLNRLYDFYRILNNQLSADFDAAVEALRAYLPQMTQKGSTDDISIAGIQIG